MFFKEELEKIEGNIELYIDMDGVIADFDVGNPKDYDKKRPLKDSITKLEEISKMPNVNMHILSITRMSSGIEEKNNWLDKFAPFFKKENRIIISREENNFENSADLKTDYLKKHLTKGTTILVDDDIRVIDKIKEEVPEVLLYKDTCLVD